MEGICQRNSARKSHNAHLNADRRNVVLLFLAKRGRSRFAIADKRLLDAWVPSGAGP
jgi:hypothetical protein